MPQQLQVLFLRNTMPSTDTLGPLADALALSSVSIGSGYQPNKLRLLTAEHPNASSQAAEQHPSSARLEDGPTRH